MKANERAATDRDARRSAGHHIVVTSTVIRLVVAYRPNDRILVGDLCELWQVFANTYPGHVGFNWPKFTSNLDGSFGLRIKGLEMRWPTIHPNQDAVALWFGPFTPFTLVTRRRAAHGEQVNETTACQSSKPKLQTRSSKHRYNSY